MKSRSISALCGALVAAVLVFQAPGLAQMRKPTGVSAITAGRHEGMADIHRVGPVAGTRRSTPKGSASPASYIADHLKDWGVKPGGDDGSYFQVVKVLGVNVKRNSSVTVTVNGQTKTFKDGEGVTFPANAGGKQTITANAEFVGYGLSLPEAGHRRLQGARTSTGKIAIYRRPRAADADRRRRTRLLGARARNAIELQHAVAAIGPARAASARGGAGRGGAAAPRGPDDGSDDSTPRTCDGSAGTGGLPARRAARDAGRAAAAGGGRGGAAPASATSRPCSGSTTRSRRRSPRATTFFDFVFSAAGQNYADIKAKADAQRGAAAGGARRTSRSRSTSTPTTPSSRPA